MTFKEWFDNWFYKKWALAAPLLNPELDPEHWKIDDDGNPMRRDQFETEYPWAWFINSKGRPEAKYKQSFIASHLP